MNILVTGSAGFVGQELIPLLQQKGHRVIGIDLKKENVSDESLTQDILNTKILPVHHLDLCIHLASDVGGFLHNFDNKTIQAYELDLLKNVKRICDQYQCRHILYTSSINVFEQADTFITGPLQQRAQHSSYGQAKEKGEEFVQNNFEKFIIVRPTNIFGKSQITPSSLPIGKRHVIPELLQKIDQDEVVEILGNGSQLRNFIHVTDVCRFIIHALSLPKPAWFNLRSDIHLTITELAHLLSTFKNSS